MSLLKANSVQIGQSTTATQNFTLSVPSSPDGTIKLARGNSGATTADILSVNASGAITGSTFSGVTITSSTVNGGTITSGTYSTTTGGTAIDFTSIPSWVKKITVMLNGISTSGASIQLIRIGTSSGIDATSYTSGGAFCPTGSSVYVTSGSGFVVPAAAAGAVTTGIAQICNISSNIWIYSFSGVNSAESGGCVAGGSKTLSGTLDRVRLTTVNGTDTFDAMGINILYEG